ncbi:chaplin [Streptomyces sp. NPDC057197]|uniref:chaplin n=1 Tax=unclassified Streptomyces TaxID=2593676 RepID=UPI0009A10A2A|nr:chaplin [Streptomyces sp. SAT1]
MRQTLSRGVFAAAAATSVLSLYGSAAFADSTADGVSAGSPGVLSGNTIQAPVEVPVNACGNTVDAAAALNPAFGNKCANVSDHTEKPTPPPSHTPDCDDQGAYGEQPSSGAYGEEPSPGPCSTPPPSTPPATPPATPPSTPPATHHTTPPPVEHTPPQMAETGSGNTGALIGASAVSAVLIAGGTVLYRRGRSAGSHR